MPHLAALPSHFLPCLLPLGSPAGTSYLDFVQSVHLPSQLAQVDPIVASFCGGAVGVLSALLLVEVNNIKKQQKDRWAHGGGWGGRARGGRRGGAEMGFVRLLRA